MINNIMTRGHSNDTIQKPGYGFLFVFYSNYGSIFSCFWDSV